MLPGKYAVGSGAHPPSSKRLRDRRHRSGWKTLVQLAQSGDRDDRWQATWEMSGNSTGGGTMGNIHISKEQKDIFDGFVDILKASAVTNLRFNYQGAFGEDWSSDEAFSTNGSDYFNVDDKADGTVKKISEIMTDFYWEKLPEIYPNWDQYDGSSGYFDWDIIGRRCTNKHRWDNDVEMQSRSQFEALEIGVQNESLTIKISDIGLISRFPDEDFDYFCNDWEVEDCLGKIFSNQIERVSVYVVGLGCVDFADTISFEGGTLIIRLRSTQSLEYLDELQSVYISIDLDLGEVFPEIFFDL